MKKYLPILFLVVGFLLVLGAGLFAWFSGQQPVVKVGTDVPPMLASLPLSSSQAGGAALSSIQQLHVGDFKLKSAIVAVYGTQAATLWVAETGSDAQALQMIQSMDEAIQQGGTPFTPNGAFQFRNRDVYLVDGSAGTTDFFMQAGSKVIWVETQPEKAEQAMIEMLDFYP